MPDTARIAVVHAAGQPPVVEELRVAAPAADEVRIGLRAGGICHTDLAMASGELWPYYPIALGHEIAGVVEAVGGQVASVSPGDRVIVTDGHCGRCRHCEAGHPVQCRSVSDDRRMDRLRTLDGEPVLQSVAGFGEVTTVPERDIVKVPDYVPFDVAAVTGCSGMTGLGAVFNTARVQPGQSVAVLGCGGVGVNAVMAARISGATTIVAVDPNPGRRALAGRLGATAAVEPDPATLHDLAPDGFDAVIECVGQVRAVEMGLRHLARGGALVVLGVAAEDVAFSVPIMDLLLQQKRILGCLQGDKRPHVDFPRYWELYRSGALDLDALVTARIDLDSIATGFAMAGAGDGIRTVVTIDG